MSDIKFKTYDYKRDSLEIQRNLFKDAFPERIGTAATEENHYLWKFHTFPDSPSSYEYAAYHDDRMIGYYAAIPYRYIINGKEMTCAMVCDVMTHSSMRGKGIFTKIGRYSTDALKNRGLHFTSGYPIRPEVIPGHLKVGWEKLFRMPLYIKVLKVNAILAKVKLSSVSFLINPLIKISSIYKLSCAASNVKCETYDANEIDKIVGYDDFFAKWSLNQRHYLIKSSEFLKWRLSAPEKNYKIICVRKDKNIIVLSIIAFTDVKGVPSIGILDLMVLDGYYSFIKHLFKTLEELAVENNAEVIIGMFCKQWANKYKLLKYAMIKSNIFFTLILKQLDQEIDFTCLKDEKNWNLTWLDSDNL